MSSVKEKPYVFLFIFFLNFCGNPAIIRYLEPQNPPDNHTIENARNPVYKKYKIFNKNGVIIYLKNATPGDIERILKADVSSEISFRIPPLTYLEFFIYNKSDKIISVNFFDARLTESKNNAFKVYTLDSFLQDFTSVAYKNFRYEKIFSFYVTEYLDNEPKNGFFYEKFLPGKTATLKPGFNAIQIVPFERISERNIDLTLTIPVPDIDENLRIPLKYVIRRTDRQINTY